MNILAIIPARSGSKSVINKNIRKINGKPMLAYSIEHAKKSKYINRIIVSTDSEEYAKIALEYGAEVPFIRPKEYASDTALDYEVFNHAINILREKENYNPDIIVQLRPTYPIRNIDDIDNMIKLLIDNKEADSVRSVALAKEIPFKMWYKDELTEEIKPVITDIKDCYNMPRQQLRTTYYQNACIDVLRPSTLINKHSMSGDVILGYIMKKNYDIDTEEDMERAEEYIKIQSGNKRFVFDIDGVIAKIQKNNDYSLSEPNEQMIEIVNKLYGLGNEIILLTARGYVTKKDWESITRTQLEKWGVKYNELHFGKPNADYYVDDHMISMESLIEMFN